MNIRLAYPFDYDLFKILFSEMELFDWNRDRNTEIDLLIFSGGEDVSPDYYLDSDMATQYGNLIHNNPNRDAKEIEILRSAVTGELKVKKIYGSCRGMQLFNVMFGGGLFFDLETYGYSHPYMHSIRHKTPSNVEFFQVVNSLHHQGVKNVGDNLYRLNIDRRSYPKIIAMDETGHVPEIMTWLNDKVLAVQFHPEYYDEEHPDKTKFKEFIQYWVEGKTTVLKNGKEY